MPAVPKPSAHVGPGERYQTSRQRFLEGKGAGEHGCECAYPNPCPRGRKVTVRRDEGGVWRTDGDVDHALLRSRHPDLREDHANLRLLDRWVCHRQEKDHHPPRRVPHAGPPPRR